VLATPIVYVPDQRRRRSRWSKGSSQGWDATRSGCASWAGTGRADSPCACGTRPCPSHGSWSPPGRPPVVVDVLHAVDSPAGPEDHGCAAGNIRVAPAPVVGGVPARTSPAQSRPRPAGSGCTREQTGPRRSPAPRPAVVAVEAAASCRCGSGTGPGREARTAPALQEAVIVVAHDRRPTGHPPRTPPSWCPQRSPHVKTFRVVPGGNVFVHRNQIVVRDARAAKSRRTGGQSPARVVREWCCEGKDAPARDRRRVDAVVIDRGERRGDHDCAPRPAPRTGSPAGSCSGGGPRRGTPACRRPRTRSTEQITQPPSTNCRDGDPHILRRIVGRVNLREPACSRGVLEPDIPRRVQEGRSRPCSPSWRPRL